jgi:mannobiose 2-epimerase
MFSAECGCQIRNPKPESRRKSVFFACLAIALLWPLLAGAADRAESARDCKRQLAEKIMPYWYDTAVDRQHGGYLLSDDAAKKAPPATEKQIVTQSRMVWGFAQAHREGLSTTKRNYLKAAQQGYRFLLAHFLDPQNGGYYWTTDLAGKPLNQRKIVYGESFVIYGLVEYYRASRDERRCIGPWISTMCCSAAPMTQSTTAGSSISSGIGRRCSSRAPRPSSRSAG